MMTDIITIGFDKQNDADFSISTEIRNLDYNKMNELRVMITIAIGTAEDMWRRANQEKAQKATANDSQ